MENIDKERKALQQALERLPEALRKELQGTSTQRVQQSPPSLDTTKAGKPGKKKARKLEQLPAPIMAELDQLIARGLGEDLLREKMIAQYGDKYPVVHAVRNSYRNYINVHKDRIELEHALPVSDSMTGKPTDLDDTAQVLANLFCKLEERSQKIERSQEKNWSPRLEQALARNMEEQVKIIMKAASLDEQLSKAQKQEFYSDYPSFAEAVKKAMLEIYKGLHGDVRYQDFESELSKRFKDRIEGHLRQRGIELPPDLPPNNSPR